MPHLTFAQCICWICSRDSSEVLKVAALPPSDQLSSVRSRFLVGVRVRFPEPEPEPGPLGPEFVQVEFVRSASLRDEGKQNKKYMSFDKALDALTKAIAADLNVWVKKDFQSLECLPPTLRRTLTPRMTEDGFTGLWSRATGTFLYDQFFIDQAELAHFWPVSSLTKKADAILEALLIKANGGKLKRDEALEIAKSLPEYSPSAIEIAWSKFPVNQKDDVGKRGKAKKNL